MGVYQFLTGSYTEADLFPGSKGNGIELFELDAASGALTRRWGYREISSPAWVAADASGCRVAVASEHSEGASKVYLLEMGAGGGLKIVEQVTAGDCTCHTAFAPDGGMVASAAYLSGEVQWMQVGQGAAFAERQVYGYQGSGPNRARQGSAHAHQVVFSPDGQWLYVPDLGADTVWGHRVARGQLSAPAAALRLPGGEGPRHMVFDWEASPYGFVLAELTANVHSVSRNAQTGELEYIGAVATLPAGWGSVPSAAAIRLHPRLPVIYASNRDDGRVCVLRFCRSTGALQVIGALACEDPSPRDINVSPDGRWLLVGGQATGQLFVYPLDAESGAIGPLQQVAACPSVVCIAWLNR